MERPKKTRLKERLQITKKRKGNTENRREKLNTRSNILGFLAFRYDRIRIAEQRKSNKLSNRMYRLREKIGTFAARNKS